MIKKYLKKKINGIKICAVITAICFMVSTLGANLYAIPMSETANKKYEDVFNKASSISSEYGKITALKDANSTVTVVNIQDLHCHAQTQRNISKIIEQLARKYNLKRIYVEGGYGNIDTSWLNSVKDENVKKQVIEELLEQGILTGSEYYKITSGNKEIELKGIDEEKLHKENIKRLSWMIDNQSKYKKLTENIDKEIELLEKKYVNSENKRFSTNIGKYTKNEIDTKRFYRQLIKYVKDINNNPQKYNNVTAINLDDYPNIMKFMKLTKISQKINVKEITSQLYMVINDIKTKLPYNVYTKFVEETGNFQDSQKLVELISLLCDKAGIDLDNKYSSLKVFLESNELNRNLNSVELVQEERHLIEQIRAALSYSNEEYEITYISDFSASFKDYLEYKLMEGDWQYFKQGFAKFRNLYGKYAVTDRLKEIEQDFSEINNYYEINDKRNDVFVNNLLENEKPQLLEDKNLRQEEEVLAGSKDVIIAVTGGFHSQALEEILEAKEVNTIVITPSIYEGIDKATKVYKGIIKDQSKQFQSQALAYTIASCQTDKNKQNILLNVVKDIVGTNSDKIREILGTDVDLSSLDNTEQLTTEEQKDASLIKQILSVEANSIAEILPVEGGKTILLPDMDKLIIAVSKELVDIGIFLSDGAIFDIENSGLNGKDLKGIPAEIYSRMAPEIQTALLNCEAKAEGIGKNLYAQPESDKTTTAKKQQKKYKKAKRQAYSVKQQADTDKKLSEDRRRELLNRIYDKNINGFNKLISVCEQYEFDLTKDSPLLDIFIKKINEKLYVNLDEIDGIVKRSLKVSKTFLVDTDLKFSCLEKYIDTFDEESEDEEIEDEYIQLFRTLFSLKQENIEYFNEKIDAENAEALLLFFEKEDIDDNLTFLLKKHNKALMDIDDANRIEYLFDNMIKLDNVSETDFAYLMSLPKNIFAVILNTSQDSSQITDKLNFCRDYNLPSYDITKVKALFDNAEKIKNLSRIDFAYMMVFDNETVSFILNRVRDSSDIEKILYFHRIMGISTKFDNSENVNDFKDPRFKALVKYISVGDKDFFNELFADKKITKIIADSIEDGNFIKDYILNPDYKDIYTDLFTRLVNLNIKNIATENNHLALKLFIDEEFNNILKNSGLANISDENNIVAKYHCAIAVSRFIFDSVGEEVTDYDLSSRFFRDIVKQALDSYLTYSKAMKDVVLIDENTQIFALCNNEAYDRIKSRFNTSAMKDILSFIKKHKEITNFERSKDEQAAKKWLSAIRNFGINDNTGTQNAYFVFRGHGGKTDLEIVSPSKPKVFRDQAISEKQRVKAESITVEELADALIYAATREKNPIDLRKITIDLSCCNSYYFARTLYSLLAEKGLTSFTFPTIITAAGLETEFGYTISNNTGNLHKGIMSAMSVMKVAKGSLDALTLDMIATMEYQMTESNITMFTSFNDEKLLDEVEQGKTKIRELYSDMQKSKKASKKMKEIETVLKNKNLQQVSSLPKRMVEASIFSPIKNSIAQAFSEKAHIWEEIVFRAVPAIVAVINPVVGIPLFLIMQPLFVFSHTIVKWVIQKDSAGTDKKAKFIKLLQTDVRDLSKPLLFFVAPYILSLLIALSNPIATLFFIPVSSSLSQYGHYRYNQIVREQEDQKAKILSSIGSLQDELAAVDTQIKTIFIDSVDKYEGTQIDEQKENTIRQTIISNLAKFEDVISGMNKIEIEVVSKFTELDTSNFSEEDLQECVTEIYRLQEKLDSTLALLTDKMSYIYTDETTRNHVLNVVEITKKMIEEKTGKLQISFEEEQYYKYLAVMNALLHDIGKDLTPEGILNKPTQLTVDEFAIMKMHTQKGASVLEDEQIAQIYEPFIYGAKYHHIRYTKEDGLIKVTPRSYPVMTQEDQDIFNAALNSLPFNEQKLTFLIAVVDVYEALTAKRPYKEPMSAEDAFRIMGEDNGLTQKYVELLSQVYMPEQKVETEYEQNLNKTVFVSPIEIIKNKIMTLRMNILAPVADKGSLLSKNAHIWEEIVFRAVPAIIAVINPVIGIPLFFVMQPLFIFSHTIVKWLVQKDSSGEEKLSFKELAKNDFKNLALPTAAMSLPYVIAFALPMFAPFATVLSAKIFALFAATVTAQAAHYEYNKSQDSDKNLSIIPGVSSLVVYNGSKLNDILNQNVVVTTKSGSMHILNFSPKTVSSAGRYLGGLQKGEFSSYGIENVEYDNEGNIVSVTFKEGTTVSTLKQDGKALGSQENNIDFSREQLTALYSDTNTSEYVDVYLDGDSNEINKAIKEAAENNKLIVFHLFKEGFNTFEMSPSQVYENYQKAYSLISNRVHLSEIFPDLNKDKEYTDFSLDFFLQEMVKNAFVHGNLGNFEYPIAVNIKLNENGTVETLSVYNGLTDQRISRQAEFLANSSLLFGDHMGSEIMRHNPVRTYSTKEEKLNDIRFWKATTSVRDIIDESNVQWEYDYKHPKQKTRQEMLEDFWGLQTDSTVGKLYNSGFEKYLKQYLKQTGKLEKDLTQEEIMEVEEKAKYYRYTFPGLVHGVFLETFALFSKDFMAAHGNMSFGMKIVVWTIRALSVGLGITAAVCTFSVLPLSSVLLAAAISSVVGAGSVISSGFIIHLLWNTFAVITNNEENLLQASLKFKKIRENVVSDKNNIVVSTRFVDIPNKILTILSDFAVERRNLNNVLNNTEISKYMAGEDLIFVLQQKIDSFNEEAGVIKDLLDLKKELKTLNHKKTKTVDDRERIKQIKKEIEEKELNIKNPELFEEYFDSKITLDKFEGKINHIRNHFFASDRATIREEIKNRKENVELYYLLITKNIPNEITEIILKTINSPEKFNSKDHEMIHNYINDSAQTIEEQKEREKIIKFVSKIYAKKTWENFKSEYKDRINTDSDGNEYIELEKGHFLTYERWEHICDGHSIFTNGNEREGKNRYLNERGEYDSNKALDCAITLDKLCVQDNVNKIVNDEDVLIYTEQKDSLSYMRRIEDKVYVYIEKDGFVVTCYVIDGNLYEKNVENYIIETIAASKRDLMSELANNFSDTIQDKYIVETKVYSDGEIRGKTKEQRHDSLYWVIEVKNYNSSSNKLEFADVSETKTATRQELEKMLIGKEISYKDAQTYLDMESAILPENMAVVNESLQKGESAIKVAAKIAIAEIKDSLLPDFVERHESQAGKAGAAQIRDFLDKYMPVAEKASKISARLGRIVEKMIIGASVVKHIAIDYKFIKSSGIQDAIKMFGTNAKLSEDGKIEIGIVEDIEEANNVYELENTGIKINGSSIYRVAGSDLLLYGAKGNSAVKVAQVINGTNTIKEEIKKILNKEGIEADEIETEGIVRTSEEGIGIKEGLLEIGEMELEGKTAKQINTFITSSLEVKRAIGIMFAQKTIVGLESITDINKLKIAIENGRTRKVITEEQYKMLNLTKEEIDGLREQGIEIYIDGNESKKEYMENGISGQIIRNEDGVKIRDYYMQEDVEIKEILTEQESVEQALVNQEKPILVDIEILKKQFKAQRDITNIQRELGALLGKIKVNMKIGELTINDIENIGYNVSFNKVPQLKEKEIEELLKAETKEDVISVVGAESEFAIILKSIKTKELAQTFIELIKERILAKKSLLESKNELEGAELQEKKQEIMLGKMLYRQVKNKYSDTKEVDMDDVTGANAAAKLMENIEKLKSLDSQNKSKDTREQEVLVNTIIEIILYDGKRVKGDAIKEQKNEDMSKTYRAMLAAA